MKKTNMNIDVVRDRNDIVEDLMEYRNEKVIKEIDLPIEYKVNIFISEEMPENAFYEMFAESVMEMVPRPPTKVPEVHEVAQIVNHTIDAKVPIKAKPENISKHEPVFNQAYEALLDSGYRTVTNFQTDSRNRTVEQTIEDLEDTGIEATIRITNGPEQRKIYDIDSGIYLDYNAEDQTFYLNEDRESLRLDRKFYEDIESDINKILEDEDLL